MAGASCCSHRLRVVYELTQRTFIRPSLTISYLIGQNEVVVAYLQDIVAINQHPYTEKGCLLNDDVANLARVVHSTAQTLFCLDAECTSLKRIWCLYEASKCNIKYIVVYANTYSPGIYHDLAPKNLVTECGSL